jgi:ribulose 1,5-bisphosphate carboxylase large subunit-like protein
MCWVTVECEVEFEKATTKLGPDDWRSVATQIARDAAYGTFGELPWAHGVPVEEIARATAEPSDSRSASLQLKLNEGLFPVARGGLQHLFGILCDLFGGSFPGWGPLSGRVTQVRLPSSIAEASEYRGNSHKISDIRNQFGLGAQEPLMAFSVKPRVGLNQEDLTRTCCEVLSAGFHIVELDTRDLGFSVRPDEWINIAVAAQRVGDDARPKRITRFSANFTVPWHLAETRYQKLVDETASPYVVKVDFGIDGLGTVQALRTKFRDRSAPIVTSYPLLRNAIRHLVPQDTLVEMATISGVDIIYPGNRPTIPTLHEDKFDGESATRMVDPSAIDSMQSAVARYDLYVKADFPMPTVAGGVHPGELHAYYELLGPNVAYFLGGAVALHTKGPQAGAKLCRAILKHAFSSSADGKDKITPEIKSNLMDECQESYTSANDFAYRATRYVSPRRLAGELSKNNYKFSWRLRP